MSIRESRTVRLQNGAGYLTFRTSGEFLSLPPDDRAFLDALAALLDKYEMKYAATPPTVGRAESGAKAGDPQGASGPQG